MKKKIRIIAIISIAYFILWFVQFLAYAIFFDNQEKPDYIPKWLAYQLSALVILWVFIGIIAAIMYRKEIKKEIKTFINE